MSQNMSETESNMLENAVEEVEDFCVQDCIDAIASNPGAANAHVRSGGLSLSAVKECAKHLCIPSSQSKNLLVKAIVEKVRRQQQLADIERAAEASRGTTFRKDKNTIPRIINLLMQYPDALQRSFSLATRYDICNN